MVVLLFCTSIIADTAYFFKVAPTLIFQKYFRALIYIYCTDSLPPRRHHAPAPLKGFMGDNKNPLPFSIHPIPKLLSLYVKIDHGLSLRLETAREPC